MSQKQEDHNVFGLPERMPSASRRLGSSGQSGRLYRKRYVCTSFGGLAGHAQATATELRNMENLSPDGYPALVTGNARPIYLDASSVTGAGANAGSHGMTVHRGKLIFVRGNGLYQSSACGACTRLGSVENTNKRFASFGELLFILPDKLVYDATTGGLKPFCVDTGNMAGVTIDREGMTILSSGLETIGFRVGDGIRLEVQDSDKAIALNGYYRISRLTESSLSVEGGFPEQGVFTVRVRRVMPDLDGICTLGNRLYGFAGQSIYACEAGNPWNWYAIDPTVPDAVPFSMTATGEGSFTACGAWQGYPIFFKENGIVRLTGRVTAVGNRVSVTDAALSEQYVPGIPAEQAATLCELEGALYYSSGFCVYRYTGMSPVRVDDGLPEGVRGVCAGSDGRSLYLSVIEPGGASRLYLYRHGRGWYRQDEVSLAAMLSRPVEMAAGQGSVCLMQQSDGTISMARSFAPALTAGFLPLAVATPHAMAEFGDETALLPDGGRLLAVYVRASGVVGSQMTVYVRYDGTDEWTSLCTVEGIGQERLIRIPVPPHPCRWFRLRLKFSGSGVLGDPNGVFRVSGMWWDTEQTG